MARWPGSANLSIATLIGAVRLALPNLGRPPSLFFGQEPLRKAATGSPREPSQADVEWSAANNRRLPLKLSVLLLSGSECCRAVIETLEITVAQLKAKIHLQTGIPQDEQQLLFGGTTVEMECINKLHCYGDLFARATTLVLVKKVPNEARQRINQLADQDASVRRGAAIELGKRQLLAALPALEEALRSDEDWIVRQNAATALGKFGAAAVASLPVLDSAMRNDPETNVQMHATTALKEIGAPAIPLLQRALHQDSDEIVRFRAAEALGKLGDVSAIPALKSATTDRSVHVRQGVSEALMHLRRERFDRAKSQKVCEINAEIELAHLCLSQRALISQPASCRPKESTFHSPRLTAWAS